MKKIKSKIAAAVAMVMICSSAFSAIPASAVNEKEADPVVLYSNSFETTDAAPIAGEAIDGKLSNVGVGGVEPALSENFTSLINVSSIQGGADNGAESKDKLFDNNKETKWLCRATVSEDSPLFVSFGLNESKTVNAYLIQSANDSEDRDPVDWNFCGSTDGINWNVLDTRSGIYFTGRFESHVYSFENTAEYTYYKLEITKNRGSEMTQFAELAVGTMNTDSESEVNKAAPLSVEVGTGPSATWCNTANDGWTGAQAISVTGRHIAEGAANCSNVLYKDVNIAVDKDTNLSYVIFPSFFNESSDGYDFEFLNMHFMIDLQFTDGTFLSDLGAVDQNGVGMTPDEQSDGECLYTMQWNQVISNIGAVATGKTIDKILVNYACDYSEGGHSFRAFFDDIVIESKAVEVYDHLSDYVNPLRGTNSTSTFSRGLTVPAVTVPNGFNYYTPVTNTRSNSPYYYQLSNSKNTMAHFEITHIASNWVGGWGSWQFMANTSVAPSSANSTNLNSTNRAASFSHDNEESKAHYYGVTFNEGSTASGVKMEMTPTDHAVYVKVTFPEDAANRNIVFDCDHANGGLKFNNDGTFTAYSDHNQNGSTRMFVYGEFVDGEGNTLTTGTGKIFSDNTKSGFVSFPEGTTEVNIKIATSYMSYTQAEKNLNLEIGENDTFADVYTDAQKLWDDKLGMFEIEGASYDQLVTFYSCVYRMYMYPTNYSENTGTADSPVMSYASPYQNGKVVEGQMYTNNGFWDTYRTTWAGYALFTPNQDTSLLNGLVQHYKDSGWVPRWINPAGTNSMVGTSSDVIFGDAAVKGIDFDMESALEASIKNATVVAGNLTNGGRRALTTSNFLGYTSLDNDQAFSWAMEGYINDYGISQLASVLGKTDESYYFRNRSRYYINMFNDNLGWFMGKKTDGTFRTNSTSFDPSNWGWGGDYTETNAWNMAFSVVQDGQGLANLYGGRNAMEEKLDALFTDDIRNTRSGGIHEMKEAREVRMGQYGHCNQPAHHIVYMYDYAGAPYKTAQYARETLAHCYAGSSIGQGYLGDEDNGEMSAWYVFSALGFYPVSMGNAEYAIGSPLFTKATIHMDNGKTFVINAENNSKENIYIQSAKLNGTDYNKCFLTHSDIANGGEITFEMGSEPSAWATSSDSLPTSITKGTEIANPAIDVTKGLTINSTRILGTTTTQLAGNSEYQALFDDTSAEGVELTGETTEFKYFTPNGKSVSGYTITTSSDATKAPTGYTLSASNDNKTWVDLDVRTDETFDWALYTKPFYVASDKQAVYKYYRLTITGAGNLAEVELLGTDDILSEGVAINNDAIAAAAVDEQIAALGEITSTSQKTAVNAAREAYKNLENSAKILVTKLDVLEAAEAKIKELEDAVVPGDVSGDGLVTVSDVVELRKLIMAGKWTDAQLSAGDLDGNKNLTVSDVVELRALIMKGVD